MLALPYACIAAFFLCADIHRNASFRANKQTKKCAYSFCVVDYGYGSLHLSTRAKCIFHASNISPVNTSTLTQNKYVFPNRIFVLFVQHSRMIPVTVTVAVVVVAFYSILIISCTWNSTEQTTTTTPQTIGFESIATLFNNCVFVLLKLYVCIWCCFCAVAFLARHFFPWRVPYAALSNPVWFHTFS